MYVVLRNFVAMDSPRARTGTPIECAKVIAFLASDAARVGQTIEANGGQLMLGDWKLVDAWSFNEKSSRAEKAKSRVSACF